ncbi:MAG: hypothetical protein COV74_07125 [Candidatus Omnitrophica bacterium CG11_big_fil_rev_8_21_14_0_20_45_26]|uniref:Uncharacterized protein n=1 Tax=Candidatus Abzuiibacterium crystallinum TaxID=1974748 RepID=A0A2H0LNC4_9BACT|nr:MAG: hypothetical protein COV74_07125 [Candidatus Omnitrophica bacterium CG11_big_fil_rev_8_21_14_0_20_45_26]PIW63456.1 MAG: hypothetical protein COW12_10465 [Candidatus Omnitrophica bacterium CG12_big_fil_rev_8_21_14_0_65_45_16]
MPQAAGRWQQLTLAEQMANIGSEVERALNWREKKNMPFSQRAFERALELIDLTLADKRHRRRFNEITRMRESMVDFFYGENELQSTAAGWQKYFLQFAHAARRHL